MSLLVGIVGLPNAGKSTLFNALLGRAIANTAPYPFCTIEPNEGVVAVPDERLEKLAAIVAGDCRAPAGGLAMTRPPIVPAVVKFIDIAGLVKGAHKGEGLGNKFLAHIREVDCICFVLRDFEDANVVKTGSDPKSDLETLKTELILKDLETVEKGKKQKLKTGNMAQNAKLFALLGKLAKSFNQDLMVSQLSLDSEEREIIKPFCLLTDKPYFVVLNVSENDLLDIESKIKSFKDWTVIPICAKLEEQLSGLSKREQKEYLSTVGLKNSALDRIINTAYEHLKLIRFYTIKGGKEISAWSVRKGTNALKAAGTIHSDFAKKFIKAEVISFQKLFKAGSWSNASQKGLIELHGRDYEIQDGDVVEVKIN